MLGKTQDSPLHAVAHIAHDQVMATEANSQRTGPGMEVGFEALAPAIQMAC